ncbi:sugar kinase [Staphylococcus kloosii]|jgi:2-dehydro-3-deoxygluconokinase|uniref:sugar kinase n=1 Tax=Staphylococcus kloosii TaxID=29384 RepID=UPI00189C5CF1|nr:sugar kinase [Staphylococcus kloosii]MBF7023390.1 sugar kinase [Staphylococcus kloosii]
MTIYGLGEVLLRFTPPNYEQLKNARSLNIQTGGAELNTLVTLAGFKQNTAMLTTLPQDNLKDLVEQTMRSANVSTKFINYSEGRLGTYYMEEGFGYRSGQVIYDRDHSTFAIHGYEQLQQIDFNDGDYLILTGITLAVNTQIRDNIVDILTKLKKQGVKLVFDINYRGNLWSTDEAIPVIKSVLPLVDILLFGKKDATHLLSTNSESDDMETCARTIQAQYNIPVMASSNRDITESTLQGIMLIQDNFITSPKYQYTVLNRIGAGDAFTAGIIHGLLQQWDLAQVIDFATKCSVLQHTTNEDSLSIEEQNILYLSSNVGELKR